MSQSIQRLSASAMSGGLRRLASRNEGHSVIGVDVSQSKGRYDQRRHGGTIVEQGIAELVTRCTVPARLPPPRPASADRVNGSSNLVDLRRDAQSRRIGGSTELRRARLRADRKRSCAASRSATIVIRVYLVLSGVDRRDRGRVPFALFASGLQLLHRDFGIAMNSRVFCREGTSMHRTSIDLLYGHRDRKTLQLPTRSSALYAGIGAPVAHIGSRPVLPPRC